MLYVINKLKIIVSVLQIISILSVVLFLSYGATKVIPVIFEWILSACKYMFNVVDKGLDVVVDHIFIFLTLGMKKAGYIFKTFGMWVQKGIEHFKTKSNTETSHASIRHEHSHAESLEQADVVEQDSPMRPRRLIFEPENTLTVSYGQIKIGETFQLEPVIVLLKDICTALIKSKSIGTGVYEVSQKVDDLITYIQPKLRLEGFSTTVKYAVPHALDQMIFHELEKLLQKNTSQIEGSLVTDKQAYESFINAIISHYEQKLAEKRCHKMWHGEQNLKRYIDQDDMITRARDMQTGSEDNSGVSDSEWDNEEEAESIQPLEKNSAEKSHSRIKRKAPVQSLHQTAKGGVASGSRQEFQNLYSICLKAHMSDRRRRFGYDEEDKENQSPSDAPTPESDDTQSQRRVLMMR